MNMRMAVLTKNNKNKSYQPHNANNYLTLYMQISIKSFDLKFKFISIKNNTF